ncbi:CsgG/HfaB family protein [Benzoatithermus flavus]|uniref:CsgG/HfaB family protein n=1 Tax=Benzoatithermus flavus TaxID=3108223 RepID=A0ABU8XPW9_9PROT
MSGKRAAVLAALLATAGCAAVPPGDRPVEVARGPLPSRAFTPMTPALTCLRDALPRGLDLRLAVQSIPDRTGVVDYNGPGSYVTQGAELMMVSALARSGVRQVNRTATNIAEWELQQAMEKRLGDGGKVQVGATAVPFRPVPAGALLGSTHTVYGGITELDFDLQSGGVEANIAGIGAKARGYYIGVGLDVVVADTRTTEVVLARSYRKQIWGQEVEANLFRFWDIGNGGDKIGQFGTELFDIRLGRQQNEPIHQSVRWVVEQAAYEIVRDLAGIGDRCDRLVPEGSRSTPSPVALVHAAPFPPAATIANPPAEAEPSSSPPATPSSLRGSAATLDGKEPPAARGVRLPDGTVLPVQGR